MMKSLLAALMKKQAFPAAILFCLVGLQCSAGDCFIGKPCFGVVEPYLMERVCYLWSHESRAYKPGMESDYIVSLPSIHLNTDQLHVEFLKLLGDGRFKPLERGTRVFSCQYDLNTIKRDRDEARQKGIVLPQFNCRGATFELVPVRMVNTNTCLWVAEVDVRCEEQVPIQSTPFSIFEEKLGEFE